MEIIETGTGISRSVFIIPQRHTYKSGKYYLASYRNCCSRWGDTGAAAALFVEYDAILCSVLCQVSRA